MKRSQALDVVRGIAIILVLIWHYVPRDLERTPELLITSTRMFWSGVDLFFVLSGFLIAGILLQNANSRNYFSTFYIRRAARIIPLYILLLFMLGIVINLDSEYLAEISSERLPLWSYLTFTQNFLYAAREGLDDPWMDVTWSLAVEEQFYISLSLLVRNFSRKKLGILAVGILVLAPMLRFYAPHYMVAYLLPLHRADSLMFGVLLALAWHWDRGKEFLYKHVRAFRWSFFLLFLGAAYLTFRNTWFGDAFGHFWLALFYCNFIVLALTVNGNENKLSLFKNRILEWFGLRSYGIYLLHKPVQIMIPFILGWFLHADVSETWIVVAIYTLVLFFVSELSYRLFERPVMLWGQRFKYE